jgi:hypothetical protein
MAASLEHETFSRYLNTNFRISPGESKTVELELSTVHELLLSPQQERFAIVFRGPREQFLQQGSYSFEHDEMGEFILFIVPIHQDDSGIFYEAVFNRMRKRD